MTSARGVHPTAIVAPEVTLEQGVEIGAYAVLQGRVRVGAGATIGHHCVIGARPKIRGYDGPVGEVTIGRRATIAELCSIDAPTGALTELGDDAYLMPHCYIGHDCRLGKGVTLTAGCLLGGHVWIGERCMLGLGSVVHQFSSIGALAMVGMSAVVNRDVPPFASVRGNPGRVTGVNRVGMQRAGMTPDQIAAVSTALPSWLPKSPWPIDFGRQPIAEFEAASRRPLMRAAVRS